MESRKLPKLDDAITWHRVRPFPTSTFLGPGSIKIPLLLNIVGIQEEYEGKSENEVEESEVSIEQLDDPRNSSLTIGQRKRFLALRSESGKARWTDRKRREYRSLKELVKKEQIVYRQAVDDFLLRHVNRFMAGFPSSEFSNWHSCYVHSYRDHWKAKEMPFFFGKVRQVVSLSYQHFETLIPNELFDSEIVSTEQDNTKNPIEIPSKYLPPVKLPTYPPQFLYHDQEAIKLAKKYNANAVVSINFMECILKLNSWKAVLWNIDREGIRVFEEPIPQPVIPRTCLEKGMEASMQQCKTLYTLLSTKLKGKTQRILVRSYGVSPRVHLEYFLERGVEQLLPIDYSTIMLDSILEPSSKMYLVRVNVLNWTVSQCDLISVSHVLAQGDDVTKPWGPLLSFLGALDSMPSNGNYLLNCQDNLVSLHASNDKDIEIDLSNDFNAADAVKTNKASLLSCSRAWEWVDQERPEYTFP
jgi:hypothetical protein